MVVAVNMAVSRDFRMVFTDIHCLGL